MIARKNRFHGHSSLDYVYRHGKTVRVDPSMALKYVPNTKQKGYRLAVVVSKKISKSAVVRNRIRRRVYEVFRQSSTKISEPYDIVITIFDEQLKLAARKEIEKQVQGLLDKTGITHD